MLQISPSLLSLYFYYECPRYFVYRATVKSDKKGKGIPIPPNNYNPVTLSILEEGYSWEEKVIEEKLKKKVRVARKEKGKKTRDRVFDREETVKQLMSIGDSEYLYQSTLQAPNSFYEEFNLDKSIAAINDCRPDLLQCSKSKNGKVFHTIDLKASAHMKISHKIQVTFYSLLLKHVLEDKGVDAVSDTSDGGVWLFGQDGPEMFDIGSIIPHVTGFLRDDLKVISKADVRDLPWHLNSKCELCEYFLTCKIEACDNKSVSLLPYLTVHGRKHLRSSEIKVNSLNEMKKFLGKKEAQALLARSASLNGKEDRLAVQTEALLKNEVMMFGHSSMMMPKWEDVRLILSAERDPVSGEIYALGYSRFGGKEVFNNLKDESVFIAASPEKCGMISEQFINELYDVLLTVHNYNKGLNKQDQRSVQAYVFENYEAEIINEILIEGFKKRKTGIKALQLLFYMQSESLFRADDHPDAGTAFPLVSIKKVVNDLFALPASTAYNLKVIFDLLKPSSARVSYTGNDFFDFELSGMLKGDAVFYLWHKGKDEYLARIERELKFRFMAKHYIVSGIREKFKEAPEGNAGLFAYPKKFLFPNSTGFNSKTLSKLAFITRYEKITEYLEIKSSRSLSRTEREKNGTLFSVTAIKNNGSVFKVKKSQFDHLLEDKFAWLLSEDTTEGDRAQMQFNDYWYRDQYYAPSKLPMYLATINTESTFPDGKGYLNISLSLTRGALSPLIVKGKKYILQKRFCDYNSNKIIACLTNIDKSEDKYSSLVLEDPNKYLKKTKDISDTEKFLRKFSAALKLTPSQRETLRHIVDYNLSLVWGAPGTGKTHFLAASVLSLLEQKRIEKKQCHIFVTAFTHAAIENCLNKIIELNEKFKIWKEDGQIVKLKEIRLKKFDHIGSCDEKNIPGLMNSSLRFVAGGTVYSLQKAMKANPISFDVIVIDEASQLKVPDALIPLSAVNYSGRLIIAGDDKQLPPIVKAVYPEPDEGEPRLHRSVFEVIRQADSKNRITCQLFNNFRMNSALCKYPADMLYGSAYRGFTPGIRDRRMILRSLPSKNKILKFMLDPEYPLVLGIIDDCHSARENESEADIVAQLTAVLRNKMVIHETGRVYPANGDGDDCFWQNGLFIVSPHHVQIELIKQKLKEEGLREPYFVDTVDKMQGQECEAVIVSYGVSDPEQAEIEGEFIYSLNRLNVSITRARSKSIVLIPRPLLKPTLGVLENEESAAGIAFMLGLENHCRQGEVETFALDNGASITIMRRND